MSTTRRTFAGIYLFAYPNFHYALHDASVQGPGPSICTEFLLAPCRVSLVDASAVRSPIKTTQKSHRRGLRHPGMTPMAVPAPTALQRWLSSLVGPLQFCQPLQNELLNFASGFNINAMPLQARGVADGLSSCAAVLPAGIVKFERERWVRRVKSVVQRLTLKETKSSRRCCPSNAKITHITCKSGMSAARPRLSPASRFIVNNCNGSTL